MRKRLIAGIMSIGTVALIIAFAVAMPLINALFEKEAEKRLQFALSMAAKGFYTGETAAYGSSAQYLDSCFDASFGEVNYELISLDGKLLAATSQNNAVGSDRSSGVGFAAAVSARPEGFGQGSITEIVGDARNLCVAIRLPDAVLVASTERSDEFTNALYCALCAFVAGIATAYAAAIVYSKRQLMPVRELTAAAKDLADGNWDRRLREFSDELGELGAAFNSMAQHMQNTIGEMRKLEAVRKDFVANVTHELKTPLTSIRGYVELLKFGMRSEEMRERFYDIIEIESERLQNMIDDVLSLSEIESMGQNAQTSVFDATEALKKTIETLEPIADKAGVALICEAQPRIVVHGNAHRLSQLLINLMGNGIKYNRPGGKVVARMSREGEMLHIEISDTGIGIAKEHHTRVFERFYRVDKGRSREKGGTGLGLSIVKHIVALYGGDIHIESAEGEGTTFIVNIRA